MDFFKVLRIFLRGKGGVNLPSADEQTCRRRVG
jgi:hypothetical protein